MWIVIILIGIAILAFWAIYDRAKNHGLTVSKQNTNEYSKGQNEMTGSFFCPVCGAWHTKNASENSVWFCGMECTLYDGDSNGNNPSVRIKNSKDLKKNYDNGFECVGYPMEVEKTITKEEVTKLKSQRDCPFSNQSVISLEGNRVLERNITSSPRCADTGYVVWRCDAGVYVTGICAWAKERGFLMENGAVEHGKVYPVMSNYTRRLWNTVEEYRAMSQDEIDAQAYGAYMDGAR